MKKYNNLLKEDYKKDIDINEDISCVYRIVCTFTQKLKFLFNIDDYNQIFDKYFKLQDIFQSNSKYLKQILNIVNQNEQKFQIKDGKRIFNLILVLNEDQAVIMCYYNKDLSLNTQFYKKTIHISEFMKTTKNPNMLDSIIFSNNQLIHNKLKSLSDEQFYKYFKQLYLNGHKLDLICVKNTKEQFNLIFQSSKFNMKDVVKFHYRYFTESDKLNKDLYIFFSYKHYKDYKFIDAKLTQIDLYRKIMDYMGESFLYNLITIQNNQKIKDKLMNEKI